MFNQLAPLCEKQANYIRKCQTSWFNVAHGGKRGGKNVTNGLAFCIALENHPNKLHLNFITSLFYCVKKLVLI